MTGGQLHRLRPATGTARADHRRLIIGPIHRDIIQGPHLQTQAQFAFRPLGPRGQHHAETLVAQLIGPLPDESVGVGGLQLQRNRRLLLQQREQRGENLRRARKFAEQPGLPIFQTATQQNGFTAIAP